MAPVTSMIVQRKPRWPPTASPLLESLEVTAGHPVMHWDPGGPGATTVLHELFLALRPSLSPVVWLWFSMQVFLSPQDLSL
jgi:hypothetical protein